MNLRLILMWAMLSPAVFGQTATQTVPPQTASPATSTTLAPQDLPDAPSTVSQAKAPPQPTGATVVIDSTMGRMTCKLFDKQAPVASANFVGLAEGSKDWVDGSTGKKIHHQPFYNGVTFHRVIPGFMIQGGDRLGTGTGMQDICLRMKSIRRLISTSPEGLRWRMQGRGRTEREQMDHNSSLRRCPIQTSTAGTRYLVSATNTAYLWLQQ